MEQEIRTSQALHTYGPGAIADFPELSVIVLSHDISQSYSGESAEYWGEDPENANNMIKDERLSIAFNVDCFVSPPLADSLKKARIQTSRFPSILQCPLTHELFEVSKLEANRTFYTDYSSKEEQTVDETFSGYASPVMKKRKLVPVRFVIATEDGHLDDFPFDWYVHTKKNMPEEVGKGNRLFLRSRGNTASLKNLVLESRKSDGKTQICQVSLERIFDQEDTFVDIKEKTCDYLAYVNNQMPKPWLGKKSKNGEPDYYYYPIDDVSWPPYSDSTSENDKKRILSKYPRTLQRGAGNLYFPIIYKGISIPKNGYAPGLPEDFIMRLKNIIRVLEEGMIIDPDSETKCEEIITRFRKNLHKKFENLSYSMDESESMIRKYFSSEDKKAGQYTMTQLRKQEFNCFLNPKVKVKKDEWYGSRIVDGKLYDFGIKGIIDNVVLLDKIRELKIFRGFTRIKPLMFEDLIFESGAGITGRKKQELGRIQDPRSNPETATLPSTEVKGEGIFLKFNNEILNNWAERNDTHSRFSIISKNYNNYRNTFELPEDKTLSSRYIALHTFSHILINELSIECGYGSSSLSEIIYCSETEDDEDMNGILIYTSSSDSEGTLGGLVEKGEPSFLNQIVEKALAKSKWCSSDPLCVEDKSGKGFMGVNLAACHSCCLLPETSCCNMNKFLDRALLIGTIDAPEIGLFVK